jgi:predicted ATPase
LQASVDDLIAGRGQIVSILGEAGLGKSRLVAELRRTSPETVAFYEGRCLSYQSSTPFALFVSLFNSILELAGDDIEKYASLKAQVSGLAGLRAEKLCPLIATLLGIKALGDDLERVRYLEPPQLRRGLFDAVLEVISLLAAQRPLVLVFEDLHWCDPTSLELLELAFSLVEHSPLLMLALFRPHQEDLSWRLHESAATAHQRMYTSIVLEPLSEDNTRMLVASLLQIEDLPEEVRRLILAKSDGNPFFVEEVIRSLLDATLACDARHHVDHTPGHTVRRDHCPSRPIGR